MLKRWDRWVRLGLGMVVLLLAAGRLRAAGLPFADVYAQRGVPTDAAGTGTGSNAGATREPDEPRHADRRGGRSVWLSWVAPTNGVATFSTAGSGFDTLLAVYAYERELRGGPPGPPDPAEPFDELERVSGDDDDRTGAAGTSVAIFAARAGVRYAIAVDGFAGAAGDIVLTWSVAPVSVPVPFILSDEPDRAVALGDTVTLTVNLEPGGDEELELKWFFNDEELEDEESPTLVIAGFSRANVGEYRLRVRLDDDENDFEVFTAAVEVQINSEGEPAALARDKLADALDFALVGEAGREAAAARAAHRRHARLQRHPDLQHRVCPA